jgi:DNA-binding NtrC family response regulator
MCRVLLIVEDQPSICFGLSDFFRSRGFQVDCAVDAAQAATFLERKQYGVVITDLSLAGHRNADGLVLAARVRRNRPDTRIVVLTAYGTPEAANEAKRLGIDAFLHKPARLPDLARLVDALLQHSG